MRTPMRGSWLPRRSTGRLREHRKIPAGRNLRLASFRLDAYDSRRRRIDRPREPTMEPRRYAAAAMAALALLLTTPAPSQAQALTAKQSDALAAYDRALNDFKSILAERRSQIEAKQPLPNLPGQALYLARVAMISTYKDLTDAVPSRIGKPNKFGIPPAYFDAAIEPLVDEYANRVEVM